MPIKGQINGNLLSTDMNLRNQHFFVIIIGIQIIIFFLCVLLLLRLYSLFYKSESQHLPHTIKKECMACGFLRQKKKHVHTYTNGYIHTHQYLKDTCIYERRTTTKDHHIQKRVTYLPFSKQFGIQFSF